MPTSFPKNTNKAANKELEKNPVINIDNPNVLSMAALVPPKTESKAARSATEVYLA